MSFETLSYNGRSYKITIGDCNIYDVTDPDNEVKVEDESDFAAIAAEFESEHGIVLDYIHVFCYRDDCFFCEWTEELYLRGYHESVNVLRRRDESMTVESLNVEECAFYCNRSECWYHRLEFTRIVVEGEDVCYEEFANDLYMWDDGEYHWEPQSDEDDDDDDSSPTLPQYHGAYREWLSNPATIPDGLTFGVELEVYAPDRGEVYRTLRNHVFFDGKIVAERDGSLSEYHGIEFVGAPMLFDDYKSEDGPWFKWLKILNDNECRSWDEDGYGMHVNIGRKSLSEHQQALFTMFINEYDGLSEYIAGRRSNQWARFQKKTFKEALVGGDKYQAVHVKSDVLEVRIFRGTLNFTGFMRNIEYCKAVLDFCKSASNVDPGHSTPSVWKYTSAAGSHEVSPEFFYQWWQLRFGIDSQIDESTAKLWGWEPQFPDVTPAIGYDKFVRFLQLHGRDYPNLMDSLHKNPVYFKAEVTPQTELFPNADEYALAA